MAILIVTDEPSESEAEELTESVTETEDPEDNNE